VGGGEGGGGEQCGAIDAIAENPFLRMLTQLLQARDASSADKAKQNCFSNKF
jgi:hypothetical protein